MEPCADSGIFRGCAVCKTMAPAPKRTCTKHIQSQSAAATTSARIKVPAWLDTLAAFILMNRQPQMPMPWKQYIKGIASGHPNRHWSLFIHSLFEELWSFNLWKAMLQPVATSTRLNWCRGANAGRHNKSDNNSKCIIFLTILDATLSEDLREQEVPKWSQLRSKPQSQGPEHHENVQI